MKAQQVVISEEMFMRLLQEHLDVDFERALGVFRTYGPKWSWNITTTLVGAVVRNSIPETIIALEMHWWFCTKCQNPDPDTMEMFHRLQNNPIKPWLQRYL